MAALVQYVKVAFSASPDVLADFGLVPRKAAHADDGGGPSWPRLRPLRRW